MRLTLRTLLAYLDDALEPAETKLIGQKIQESAVAGKLVSLIRLVVRQRRLKAPSVSGPNVGIDPNVVAQYLDSTLPPDQVVEVEKVLLTSDELLAEVASCHQVLALMAGKPAEVSEASRERLYALGPVARGDQLQVEESRSAAGSALTDGAAARSTDQASKTPAKPVHAEVPEYLRQSSWSQRVFPTAIVALLIVVCVGLLISDPGFLTGIREAKRELTKTEREPTKTDAAQNDAANTKPELAGDATSQQMTATTPSVDSITEPPAVVPAPTLPPSIDPTPPADAPEGPKRPSTGESKTASVDVPADAAVVAKATAPATVTPPATTVPGKDPTPVLNAAPVQYTSNDGVVLRLDEMQRHWFLVPRRSAVATGERLVVLEPFEAVFDIDRGAMVATVLGDSVIRILPPDRSTTSGLEIRRGRVLLRSSRKDNAKLSAFSIMVGSDVWRLEFLSADTSCTIEITPRDPVQFEKPLGSNWYTGALRVMSGKVKWAAGEDQAQEIGAGSALEIAPLIGATAPPSPVASGFAPEWTDSQKRKQAPMRRFATLFERQFEADQPVEMTLLALIKDTNAKVVELAVHGLAMTDSYAAMTQALAECSFEEGRFAARDGLRAWLGQPVDHGALLKEVLEQHYPPAEASAVYILLWGFRPEDATNRATSLELVTWLRNSHVEVRELAYFWIMHLTGRRWEFRATDVPARRESAVRRIENHILATGALVKPSEKEINPKKPE